MYAFEAGSRAIMAHYERLGIEAERVEKGVDHGIYHTCLLYTSCLPKHLPACIMWQGKIPAP